MNFNLLAKAVSRIHTAAQLRAGRAINQILNWRNWLIGAYIVEFEQSGEDRAEYGDGMLKELAGRLKESGVDGLSLTNLKGFRKTALTWPLLPIGQTRSDFFHEQLGREFTIFQKEDLQAEPSEYRPAGKGQTLSDQFDLPLLVYFPALQSKASSLPWQDEAWTRRWTNP